MFTIDDYINALKVICDKQPATFSDYIEFEDKIIKISCNNGELFAETINKVSTVSRPMSYEHLRNILTDENNYLNKKSSDSNAVFINEKIGIRRSRMIDEILNSPDSSL